MGRNDKGGVEVREGKPGFPIKDVGNDRKEQRVFPFFLEKLLAPP